MEAPINAVCPYYTMYPLGFPLRVLQRHAKPRQWVLDPFCGRGTTNLAARIAGLPSVGFDCNPVAVALAKAKLPHVEVVQVVKAAVAIIRSRPHPKQVPTGAFWHLAYHPETLKEICVLREGLLENCRSSERIVLRAIIMGALHGPMAKGRPNYLSNQCPRTFAPKPHYAVGFWKERSLRPPKASVLDVIIRRAVRYLLRQPGAGVGQVMRADSRHLASLVDEPVSWVITSPPYYGMRTYGPDQWLRLWFLGGPSKVSYAQSIGELAHGSAVTFRDQLTRVWKSVATVCKDDAHLVTRFGGIHDRDVDSLDLISQSLKNAGWRIRTVKDAGSALNGKRQAAQFGVVKEKPQTEYDLYATLN